MVERLCILSRNEHSQAAMRTELMNDERLRMFIGDVRSEERLVRAMQGIDLVIHAAALKRIETNRYNPEEAIQTNVIGSLNIVSAARKTGVRKVVGISSDKAFSPTSCYGQTKALMESILLAANETSGSSGPILSCTRFGNIFCSAGSVVPKWIAMIRSGIRKVPVSDLSATRFFMKIEEAVELVVSTAEHMRGNEVAIPELPAYSVGDLVEALEVEPEILGMPKFEKRHESMSEGNSSEHARRMSVSELRKHILEYVKANP